jgi:hypothetical protein
MIIVDGIQTMADIAIELDWASAAKLHRDKDQRDASRPSAPIGHAATTLRHREQ